MAHSRVARRGGNAKAAAFSGLISGAVPRTAMAPAPLPARVSRCCGRGETRPAAKNESAVFIGILGFAWFHICADSIFWSEAFFELPSISIELEIRKIRMAGCVSASRGLTNQNPYILP